MTDVADRRLRARSASSRSATSRSAQTRAEPTTSVWVSGAAGATWAMLVGVASVTVLTVIVWALGSHSGTSVLSAIRFGGQLWLLSHHAALRVPGGSLAIPPLALTILLGALLVRASSIVARGAHCRTLGDVRAVVVAVVVPYAVLAGVLAGVARSSALRPSIGGSVVTAALVGGTAATIGALYGSGLFRKSWRRLPSSARLAVDAAGRSAGVLLGMATLLVLVSLLGHGHEFASVAGDYHGATGGLAMVVFSLLLIPNAVMFAVGYLTGAGFAIGSGTSVGLAGSHLGAVPAFPLLAAVPSGSAPIPVTVCCVLAVIAAGALAGWRIAVRSATVPLVEQIRCALGAATLLGISLAIVGGFSGGASGPGRLSAVGPSPWKLGLAVTAETAALAILTLLLCAWVPALRRRVSA